jgi:hypothetical protein
MGILLAFAPFIVFAVLDRLVGPVWSLAAGTAVSAVLLFLDLVRPGRKPKILEMGTFLLFGGLTVYLLLGDSSLSVIGVRVCVDTGLLIIVLASMALRRPLTLQYAREGSPPELWNTPEFLRVNYVISSAWAAAFALMVLAELALLYVPQIPRRVGINVIVAALVGAVKFTSWYPSRGRTG